jgi:hypothetical protein
MMPPRQSGVHDPQRQAQAFCAGLAKRERRIGSEKRAVPRFDTAFETTLRLTTPLS